MTQKQSKQKQNFHPTLVYLCSKKNSKVKSTIHEDLSKSYFVRTNSGADDFTECCYAITSSSVFVFIMDNNSVYDMNCLSLLGTAIAFDIPVVGVREAGYALPYEFPKIYNSTEIVDRSKGSEYKVKSKNLPSVTTLASALKVLFMQCVIYHERIRYKCNSEINEMLKGVRINRVCAKRYEYSEQVISANSPEANGYQNECGEIQVWPQVTTNNTSQHENGFTKSNNGNNKIFKSPEPRKPLAPQVSDRVSNSSMFISKCKIRVHSPGDILSDSNSGNEYTPRKSRSRTITDKRPSDKFRRMSSLPCIKTNYMVTNIDEKNAEPKIYRFPIASKMLSSARINKGDNNLLDEEYDRLNLSRSNSPVDLRSDDESLMVFESGK